jgi:hypothetical protein
MKWNLNLCRSPFILLGGNLIQNLPLVASHQVLVHLAKQLQRRRFFRNRPIRNKNGLWRESDNIFQIRVVVSDLNSEYFGQFRFFFRGQFGVSGQFRNFFRGHSEYSDNSEFFPRSIRSTWFGKYCQIRGQKFCTSTENFYINFHKIRKVDLCPTGLSRKGMK